MKFGAQTISATGGLVWFNSTFTAYHITGTVAGNTANVWVYFIKRQSNGFDSKDLKIKIIGMVSILGTFSWKFNNFLNSTQLINGCKIFFGRTGFDYCDIQNQSTFDSNTLTLLITITNTSFNLDPSTVGTSTSTRPTGDIVEHNNFYDGTNHRIFYYDDTSIVMAYSPDGTTWHNSQKSVNTTFQSPTANNGSWTNPNNAHALDGVFATDGGTASHQWKTYGFSIDKQAVIKTVRVRVDAKSSTNTNPDTLTLFVSADGGKTKLATTSTISGLSTTLATFYSDVSQNTYWIPENITSDKIQVKLTHNKIGGSDTISLDWISIEVDYFANQTIGTLVSAAPPTKDQFSLFWDGIYVHVALSSQNTWNGLIYRRGVPNSNGSITWSASQIVIVGVVTNTYGHITITVDSNRKPMIAYILASLSNVVFSAQTDGTWITAANFPFQLNSTTSNHFLALAPMNNGSIYIVYGTSNSRLLGRLWDTSTVRAVETLSTHTLYDASGTGEFSAVMNTTNTVHIAAMIRNGATQDFVHIERVGGVIQTEKVITATVTNQIGPALSLNPVNNTLYCFYGSTSLIIVYKRYKNSWEGSANTFATELATIQTGSLVTAYQTNNTKMGVAWASGAASPFNVRYDFLTFPLPSTYRYATATLTSTITGFARQTVWRYSTAQLTINVVLPDNVPKLIVASTFGSDAMNNLAFYDQGRWWVVLPTSNSLAKYFSSANEGATWINNKISTIRFAQPWTSVSFNGTHSIAGFTQSVSSDRVGLNQSRPASNGSLINSVYSTVFSTAGFPVSFGVIRDNSGMPYAYLSDPNKLFKNDRHDITGSWVLVNATNILGTQDVFGISLFNLTSNRIAVIGIPDDLTSTRVIGGDCTTLRMRIWYPTNSSYGTRTTIATGLDYTGGGCSHNADCVDFALGTKIACITSEANGVLKYYVWDGSSVSSATILAYPGNFTAIGTMYGRTIAITKESGTNRLIVYRFASGTGPIKYNVTSDGATFTITGTLPGTTGQSSLATTLSTTRRGNSVGDTALVWTNSSGTWFYLDHAFGKPGYRQVTYLRSSIATLTQTITTYVNQQLWRYATATITETISGVRQTLNSLYSAATLTFTTTTQNQKIIQRYSTAQLTITPPASFSQQLWRYATATITETLSGVRQTTNSLYASAILTFTATSENLVKIIQRYSTAQITMTSISTYSQEIQRYATATITFTLQGFYTTQITISRYAEASLTFTTTGVRFVMNSVYASASLTITTLGENIAKVVQRYSEALLTFTAIAERSQEIWRYSTATLTQTLTTYYNVVSNVIYRYADATLTMTAEGIRGGLTIWVYATATLTTTFFATGGQFFGVIIPAPLFPVFAMGLVTNFIFILMAWLPSGKKRRIMAPGATIFYASFAVALSGLLGLYMFDYGHLTTPPAGSGGMLLDVVHEQSAWPIGFIFMGFAIIMLIRAVAVGFSVMAEPKEWEEG